MRFDSRDDEARGFGRVTPDRLTWRREDRDRTPSTPSRPSHRREPEALVLIRCTACVVAVLAFAYCAGGKQPIRAGSRGTAFEDDRHSGPQSVPGRVQCEAYDQGGEGVAYHDADSRNNGSGNLNPLDGRYLNEFRKDEGVDTSYTKFWDEIDNNPFNKVAPEAEQLYVGWTEPGEWINITVDVKKAGDYEVGLMYTSNRGGTIGLDFNGAKLADPIEVPTTFDAKEPLAWRQWHHWNRLGRAAKVRLPRGVGVLTLRILTQGNFNFDYLEFTPVSSKR
jgi:hypothetical protein